MTRVLTVQGQTRDELWRSRARWTMIRWAPSRNRPSVKPRLQQPAWKRRQDWLLSRRSSSQPGSYPATEKVKWNCRSSSNNILKEKNPIRQCLLRRKQHHLWERRSTGEAGVEVQWRSQPKIFFGEKCFDFRRITLFCLGYRLSKHKMTIYAKNFGKGAWDPDPRLRYVEVSAFAS